LPFEKKFYQKSPLKVSFVGHPLIDVLSFRGDRREKDLQIALLPGSRREEVVRILPIMLKCVEKLRGFKFVIPVAPELDKEWVKSQIKKELLSQIKVVKNNTYQIIRDSIFAFVASGTATLEACILEVPMVIIYRTSLFSYILGKMFVKTQWIGLPNIIAGKGVVPEFIQFNTKPNKIIKKVNQMIEDKEKNVLKLREVKKRLGQKGAILRTAQILSQFLKMY
jgi:lipid-A-disaccharide synthase